MQLSTIRQAAARLAVSTATIRRLIESAELPSARLGRCVRLRQSDIEGLMRHGHAAKNPSGTKRA